MIQSYANAAASRQALEARIRTLAEERGVQIPGLRLTVAIERPVSPTSRPAGAGGNEPSDAYLARLLAARASLSPVVRRQSLTVAPPHGTC